MILQMNDIETAANIITQLAERSKESEEMMAEEIFISHDLAIYCDISTAKTNRIGDSGNHFNPPYHSCDTVITIENVTLWHGGEQVAMSVEQIETLKSKL